PPFSQPDELAHARRAYAAVRGDLIGRALTSSDVAQYDRALHQRQRLGWDSLPKLSSLEMVRSPQVFASGDSMRACLAERAEITPADCPRLSSRTNDVPTWTWQDRSPPLVHLILGTVTLAIHNVTATYLMRVLAALLCAALLTIAWASLIAVGGIARFGLLVALTPMALFLTGGATPNGIEVAAAAAVWSSATALILASPVRRTRAAIDRFGTASLVLILARPISLIWFVLIVSLSAIWGGRQALTVLRIPRVRVWMCALGTVAAIAIGWLLHAQTLSTDHNTNGGKPFTAAHAARHTLAKTAYYARQMTGVFDSDRRVFLSHIGSIVWATALVAVVVLAIVRRLAVRQLLVLAAIVVATILIPVVLQTLSRTGAWDWWRGRYALPIAMGVPLLAAIGIAKNERGASRSWMAVGVIPLACVQVSAFWLVLRRYTSGVNHSWWFFSAVRWRPPLLAPALLILAYAIAVAALYGLVLAD
ncbi:MAG TPA: DUF2142 domain-containing protein, partial [Acidimicrobiia bacterium]|nr:DUF2142 domain-containing protein [Acidimicrobiia bacterium]